jgi:diguanylate cyclase
MNLPNQDAKNGYADAAIRAIRAHGLQITTQTFSVFYEYGRGIDARLIQAVDARLAEHRPVTREDIGRIYDRFVTDAAEVQDVRDVSDRMQETLGTLQTLVQTVTADASNFNAEIRRAASRFAAQECTVAELVQTLLAETRDIGARTSRIEVQLEANAQMMQTMQRSLAETRREAATDSLTGLANRHGLDQTLQAEAEKADAEGTPLSLVLLDLDHFKAINDRWGHVVGDEVLKLVGKTLNIHMRRVDLAARYGGEEFAVLLPGLVIEAAAGVADRIRQSLADYKFVLRSSGKPIGQITLSAGAAAYAPGELVTRLLERADAALYKAKRAGRNRVEAAAPVAQ